MAIYNSKAPKHYNQYWTLQDEDKDLEKMASSLLVDYLHAYGDTKERLQYFADVANSMGFHIEVLAYKDGWAFKIPDKEAVSFEMFRDAVREIRRGNFESEVVQLARIITEYRVKKRWYQKLL